MNVSTHSSVFVHISHPMFVIARLPDCGGFQSGLTQRMGETPFNHLHGAPDRMVIIDGQQKMSVIGHDNIFVQQELASIAISDNRIKQQIGGFVPLEKILVHVR